MSIFVHFKDSFTYLFEDKDWLSKTWPLFLITFIPVFGLLGLIFFKGWRFQVLKHKAQGDMDLPPLDLIGAFKFGLVLWFFTFVYLLIPSIICMLLGVGGLVGLIVDIYQIIINGFDAWIKDEPNDVFITFAIYGIWFLLSRPLYQAGMIRYANKNKWLEMLNLPLNAFLLVRFMHWFAIFYIFWLLTLVIIALVDSLLIATVIGSFLVPSITICIYYVTSAYELSTIAQKTDNKLASAS